MMISQLSPVNNNVKSYSSLTPQPNNKASIENIRTQNNLTFAQSNAIKNSRLLNKINFKGKVLAPSFDIKDIKVIQELLSKCKYGKKDLIYGSISDIRLKSTDDGLAIENFYTKDSNPDGPITGICEELTYKLGKRLEKAFGDKYIFFALDGSNREFPGGHTHLAMFKNTPENKLKIDTIRKKQIEYLKQIAKINEKINQIQQEFSNSQVAKDYNAKFIEKMLANLDFSNPSKTNNIIKAIQDELNETQLGKQYAQKGSEVNEKINHLKKCFDTEELNGCLMVDPSFNRIEEFGAEGNVFDGYVSSSIRTIDDVNAVPENTRNIMTAPFGYLKDLIPELANEKNKNAIIILYPFIDGLSALSTAGEIDLKSLNKTHPFIRFISKLNEDFKTMQ